MLVISAYIPMNVLKQYNLTNRPVVRSSASEQAKEGVVVNFIRKLPNEVFKKPRNLAGYQPTLREKEAELPVEGEEGAASAAAAASYCGP